METKTTPAAAAAAAGFYRVKLHHRKAFSNFFFYLEIVNVSLACDTAAVATFTFFLVRTHPSTKEKKLIIIMK